MKPILYIYILFLLSLTNLYSQTDITPFHKTYNPSYVSLNEYFFYPLSFNSSEILNSNVRISKETGTVKVNFAPLKLLNQPKWVLNETRLNLTQDKTNATLGVSWGLDFTSAESPLAQYKFGKIKDKYESANTVTSDDIKPLVEKRKKIESDLKKVSDDLWVLKNHLITIKNDDTQKAICILLENEIKKLEKDSIELVSGVVGLPRDETDLNCGKCNTLKTEKINNVRSTFMVDYYKRLYRHGFKFNLGYNIGIYNILASDSINNDLDSLQDNYYSIQSHNISFSAIYNPCWNVAISSSVYSKWARKSSEQGNAYVPYVGVNAAFSAFVWNFDGKNKYMDKTNFKDYGFKPGLVLGVSFEYLTGIGDSATYQYFDQDIKWKWALSPFFEIRITKETQLRISVPFSKFYYLPKTDERFDVGPFFQLNLLLDKM